MPVGCSQVDQLLARLGRLLPFRRVVGRVEDKLPLVVAVVGIVAVAVDERACCEQQQSCADGIAHDGGGTAVLLRIGIKRRKPLCSLKKFGFGVPDHIVERCLADHQRVRLQIGGTLLHRNSTPDRQPAVVVVGNEELGLVLHVLHFLVVQALFRKAVDTVQEGISRPCPTGEGVPVCPSVLPVGCRVKVSLLVSDDRPPVSLPSDGWSDVVGHAVEASHAGSIVLYDTGIDGT